jgi:hypothetical protein
MNDGAEVLYYWEEATRWKPGITRKQQNKNAATAEPSTEANLALGRRSMGSTESLSPRPQDHRKEGSKGGIAGYSCEALATFLAVP